MSFNQFKNKLLSLCADITRIINTKEFVVCVVVGLMILFFILGSVFKYGEIKSEIEWKHFMKVSQEEAKKEEIESKVKEIMSWYGADSLIIYEAILKSFDPILVATTIAIESEFNPKAISHANCLGLMQVSPVHFKKGQKWDDPVINIQVGSAYLQDRLKQFNGNIELALASYNCGPGLVIKHNYTVPQTTKNNETGKYVVKATKILDKVNYTR